VIEVPTKLKAVTLRVSEVKIKKITQTIVEGELHVGKEYFSGLDIAVFFWSSIRTCGITVSDTAMTMNSIIRKLVD
jgi:hypothetical protein